MSTHGAGARIPAQSPLTPAQADLVRLLASIAVERYRRDLVADGADTAAGERPKDASLASLPEPRR